jgi:hypothetical protein
MSFEDAPRDDPPIEPMPIEPMPIEPMPNGWIPTRESLQRYAHALTAFPRAAGRPHPRWSHVSMDPTVRGFVAAPVPLADGTQLTSELDLVDHRILVVAGEDRLEVDLRGGPSPASVAAGVGRLASRHGPDLAIDPDRAAAEGAQPYVPHHAEAFLRSAVAAVAAMRSLNETLDGEVTGPHLWPHGFDVATEWYSERLVDYEGTPTNAQIGMGWYPSDTSYLYVKPWPFHDEFADHDLPGGASWHRSGWEGARLDIIEPVDVSTARSLGMAVHDIAAPSLST